MARVVTLRAGASEGIPHLPIPLHGGAAETIKPEAILFFPWTPNSGSGEHWGDQSRAKAQGLSRAGLPSLVGEGPRA